MSANLNDAITRAKELLATAHNAAMATVNEDGSPHNTPFYFTHDDKLKRIYWSSFPGSLHSRNVVRTGQIFVVLYEANAGGGLYISAKDAHELHDSELAAALLIHNELRAQNGKPPLEIEDYQADNGQRLYSATPIKFYVNYGRRDHDGKLAENIRQEVSPTQLLQ